MRVSIVLLVCVLGLLVIAACTSQTADNSWCNQPLRAQFGSLKEVPTKQSWFKVYEVGKGVYAIAEPHNFQEVISYLITGTDRAILFDTGMGMGKISEVVRELSPLPVTVINSHTHYDHIGGNAEFDTILAADTAYTRKFSTDGWPHASIRQEVRSDAICLDKLPGFDTARYEVRPYSDKIRGFLFDGDTLALGARTLEVLRVPGHTPDCIALLDRENGYLWTGDMYYEATIWLFFDGTDLDAYERSIARFAELVPSLSAVFPAHNTPVAEPAHLVELQSAFAKIKSGEAKPTAGERAMHPEDERAVTFEFEHFSFLIRKDALLKK